MTKHTIHTTDTYTNKLTLIFRTQFKVTLDPLHHIFIARGRCDAVHYTTIFFIRVPSENSTLPWTLHWPNPPTKLQEHNPPTDPPWDAHDWPWLWHLEWAKIKYKNANRRRYMTFYMTAIIFSRSLLPFTRYLQSKCAWLWP